MTHLIDKDALVAEIERRIKRFREEKDSVSIVKTNTYKGILSFLDTLEVKEVDDELQGIEKEVAEDNVNAIDRKRIPIELKGEIKAKFKNEFNTLWQTVGGIEFANVAKHIIERLCLHFAAWGVYNLKGYCSISSEEKHKMGIKVREVDLDSDIRTYLTNHFNIYEDGILQSKRSNLPLDTYDVIKIAKHFFELGLNTQHSSINIPNIDDILEESGIDPDSKEAKVFKESYYMALEKLKAQEGE